MMGFVLIPYFLFVHILHHDFVLHIMAANLSSTELTVASSSVDRSLGQEIHLPTFECRPRHTGYKTISWYKDDKLLKEGYAELSDHFLTLSTLLDNTSSAVVFSNPLKLQGYYWCKTDLTVPSNIQDYLFRIKGIHTFVGKLTATQDSLGDHEELTLDEKIAEKEEIYEEEMEEFLFGFLPSPSVSVTKMKQLEGGLEVHFYLYDRLILHPRKPVDNELITDQHHLDYILEYLNNDTLSVDPNLYSSMIDWTNFRGIHMQDIKLKSTLGCYEEEYLLPNSEEKVIWPYARVGDIVIPENACASNNSLAVTRLCTGTFLTGATWGNPSGKCDRPAEGITEELRNLRDDFGRLERTQYIEKLNTVTKYPSKLTVTDLHITVEILKAFSRLPNLSEKEISSIISVIDKIVEANEIELNKAKSTIRLTSRILQIFDTILKSADEDGKEIRVSKKHILVDTKYTNTSDDKNHVLGLSVRSSQQDLEKGSVDFLLSNKKLPQHDSIAYFTLPADLIERRQSDFGFLCQVNMVFFRSWKLFQHPKDVLVKRHYKVIQTPVMYVSISGGPAWNLTDPVQIYFKDTVGVEIEDPVCVYYDTRMNDGEGAWSSEGCEYGGLRSGLHICRCHHLSIFAVILVFCTNSGTVVNLATILVILAIKALCTFPKFRGCSCIRKRDTEKTSQSPDIPEKFKLGTAVYVACGASIIALSFAVLLFLLSKNWRLTTDHKILFCLALTFLVSLILIFISEMHFLWSPGCMLLALIFQYTVLAVFGWLLVQAVVYQLRFAKKTDVTEITHFMFKAALSVWGAPIVIVMIIWFSKEYSYPKDDNCWLIVSEVSKVSVIPVVVLIFVTLCVNTCASYALSCRFKKDFLIGDSAYTEPVLKFRVAFTIFLFFVLTWLFGFFALHKRTTELRILFSVCVTLTAYYVTLFFIFQEISLWDLCGRCKKRGEEKQPAVPVVKYEPKSYKSVEEYDEIEK